MNIDQTLDESDTKHEQVRQILHMQDEIRRKVRIFDTDRRLNKLLKQRANANVDAIFHPGRRILFFDPVDRTWKKGILMYILGKTAHVDSCRQSRKIDIMRLQVDEKYNWAELGISVFFLMFSIIKMIFLHFLSSS